MPSLLTGASAATLFPLLALSGSLVAYLHPHWLAPLKPAIVPLLGVVMFGMGVTLSWQQLAGVWRQPHRVALGLALQFGVMPLAAWAIGYGMALSPALIAGLVLVGASPGGTASNVVCYLARGDVALSITLTIASTLLAVVATPALTWLYVGQQVPVPVWEMLWSIAKIVLLPVALGVAVNTWLGTRIAPLKNLFPVLSMVAIVSIIAIIVALNHGRIGAGGWLIALAVVAHNAIGLGAGYGVGWLVTRDFRAARTFAIEVGMQNSGLAVALAVQYFSAAAAIPGALFSIWHNLSGSALAAWWSRGGVSRVPGRAQQ
jgi:BASS family bile acid:Na+ symporter